MQCRLQPNSYHGCAAFLKQNIILPSSCRVLTFVATTKRVRVRNSVNVCVAYLSVGIVLVSATVSNSQISPVSI